MLALEHRRHLRHLRTISAAACRQNLTRSKGVGSINISCRLREEILSQRNNLWCGSAAHQKTALLFFVASWLCERLSARYFTFPQVCTSCVSSWQKRCVHWGRTTAKHCHENACLSCADDRPGRLRPFADAAKPIAAQIVSHKVTKTPRTTSALPLLLCALW